MQSTGGELGSLARGSFLANPAPTESIRTMEVGVVRGDSVHDQSSKTANASFSVQYAHYYRLVFQ